MANYELRPEEVILYEGTANCKEYKGPLQIALTSQKIVFERDKGLFKKERELVDIISLDNIKIYNATPQVKQKGSDVELQAVDKNITLSFYGILEARKFTDKIVEVITGATFAKRGLNKIKDAFNMVDDTLGLDTMGTIKGVLENGVKGTLWNGIGKKKK